MPATLEPNCTCTDGVGFSELLAAGGTKAPLSATGTRVPIRHVRLLGPGEAAGRMRIRKLADNRCALTPPT